MKKSLCLVLMAGCLMLCGCQKKEEVPVTPVGNDPVGYVTDAQDVAGADADRSAIMDHVDEMADGGDTGFHADGVQDLVAEGGVTVKQKEETPAENPVAAASETYIDKISFADLPTFQVSSENLTDGVWDTKITDTEKGENMSPQLSWDAVEGATSYAVFMIDGGWLHMDLYTDQTSVAAGELADMPRGHQYVGPYPPSGTHTYSIFVFALKNEVGKVKFMFNMGGNSIDMIYQGHDTDVDGNTGNVLAYARLDGNYTHGE